MASSRRSPRVLSVVLAAAAVAVLALAAGRSFVSGPLATSARMSSSLSLRAEADQETGTVKEEIPTGYKLPKPDMTLMNGQSRAGKTFDQDKRGNMWSVEEPVRFKEAGTEPNVPLLFALLVVIMIGAIIFFSQFTGQDPRFGGGIGDGNSEM
ncbi:unnamed protein product [Polarella glacialis]|uniref:Uncharacterized protein n=1 Tax=Polarella glacialis TaxID=89957 RepID=A0A813DG82_POLGL|nr:unnamed protein product [Polarella glacialis]